AYILEGGEEIAAFKLADPGYSSMVRFYDFSGIIVMVNEAANLSEVHGVEQSPLSRGLRPEGARGQIMNFMIAVPLLQYRIKNTLEALLEGKDYRPGRVVELTTNDEKHFLDSFIDQYFLKNSKVAPNVKLGGLDGLVDRRIRLRKEGDRPALVVFQKGPLLEVLGYDPSLNPAVQPVRDDVTLEDSAVAPELPVFLPSNPLWKAEETYAPPLTLKNPESLLTLKFQDGGEGDIVEYRFMSIDGLLLVAVAGSSIYLINRDAAISFWDRFRAWGALEKEGMIGRAGYRAILDEALQKNGLRIDGNKGNIQAIREGDDFSVLFKRGKQDALLAGWIGDDDSRSMILTSPRFSGSIIAPVGNALFEFRLVHFGDYRFLVGLSQEPRKIELRPVPPGRLPQELETMFPPAGERVTIRDPALFHAAYMELVGITQKYRPKEHGEGLYEWQFGPTSFLLNVESFRKSGVWEDIQLNLPGGLKSAPFMGLKAENRKVVRREGDVRLLAEGSIEIYGGARGPMGAPDRIYLYLVDIGGMTFLFTRRIGTHETTRLFAVLPAAKEAVLKAVKQAQGTRDPEASFQMFLDRLVRNREIVRFDLFVTDSSQEIYFADGNFSLVLPASMPNQTFERYLSRWHIAFYERERAGSAQTLKRYGLQDPKPVVNQSHPLVRLNAGPHGTLYQAGPLVACYLADFQTLFFYNKSDSAEISRRLATTRENQTTAHFSVSDDGTMGDEGAWTIRPVFARSLGTTVGNEAIDLLLNVLPGIEVNVNEIPHPGETPADVAVVTYPLDQGLTRLTGILSKELYPLISVEEMGMEPQEPGRSFYMAGPYLVQDVPGGAHGPRRFLVSAWEKLKEGQSEFSGSMVFLPLVPHEGLFYPLAGNHSSLVGKNVNRPESGSEASRRYESQLGVQTGDTRIAAGADAKGGVLYIDPTFSLLDYFGLTLSAPEREKIELAPGMIVDPEVGRIEELVAVFNDGPLTVSINTRSDYPTAGSWIPLNNGEGKNSPYRLRLPVDDLSTLKGGRIAVSYEDRVTEYQLQKRKGRGFDLLADGKKSGWIDVTGDAIALEIGTHFKVTGKIQRVTHVDSILVTGSLDQAAQEYFLAKLKGEVSVPVVYQASGESAVPVRPGEGNDWSWHNAVTKNISFARDGDFSLDGTITSTGAEAQLDSLVLTWRGQVFDNLKINGREWLWGAVDEANGEWIPFDSHALTWSVKGEAGGVPVIRDFTVELTPKGIKSASWVEHRTYTHASGDRQGRGHMIKMDLHLQPDGRIKIENASWSDENGRGLLKTAQSVVRWGDAVDLVWEDTSKGYLERRFYRLSVRENPTILDNSQNLTNTRSYPLEHEGGSVRVVWEYEGDKIRLHSVDRISGNGSRNLWNRRQIIPEDFEYQARVESEVPQFGEVESLLTVKHDASGFVVASDIQVHEEHGRWRWIGHKTFGGFWIQHMLIDGGAGKASGIHVDEGEVKDAKVKLAGETLEFRLSCEDGKIRITPLGLTAIPLAYERLDDRIVGNWLKGSSVAALLPHLSNEERFEKIGNISHRLQQLNPDASFFPDPESLIVMKDAVPGTGIRVHYCSAQTRLRFEVTMMFDSSSGSWRVLRDENTGDVTSKWNNQLAITTRYHLLSDGESELLPIPPGTTRLKSAKIPGNLNVPVFYNSTGAAGNDLRRRARNAVEGFVNYVSLIGTDLLAKDQGRFGSVRQWKGNDDGITAIVRLGEAVMGESGVEGTARSITFTTVYDPQEGSFYFNDGRTEITLDLGKGNVLTGLFQGFYHRETDSYLFVPLTDQKFAFRAFFFPGSDPLFIGITLRDGDLKDFPGARPFLDEGHARRPERKPSGSGRPTGQAPTNADTTPDASMARRRIHLSENLPIASRDLSPYLVNERDWENLITVTEADIGNDFKKHRWLHQTISTWLSEMGGDFQLLPESTAEFRQAQGELRQIWARHQNDFVALKGALAAVAPVRLWLMNANGVRLQVELMPYTPKKGQRPSWVFHPHGTTNQQVNLRFVGENPKNPGRMIQFFIPAFYKRNGADQTLAIYDPSLLGTGGIQKLKMAAFDGETWGQNPENDFLIALYDTNGVSGVESEEEPSPQESSPLKQTAARRRIVAEQRLMHLHRNVMETGDQFVVVDKTNNEIQRVVNAENPHNPPFTLLEHGKFGKGAYTGRLVQIQYPLPTV
ncbi:MAG: hypothetical protein HY541_04405, partial [Deltaproteobacteria bacterium]|nr:hypothetical protein [Deltaproteobacteria bacterium]